MQIWDVSRSLTNRLAPWPGEGHFHADEDVDPQRLPATSVAPIAP